MNFYYLILQYVCISMLGFCSLVVANDQVPKLVMNSIGHSSKINDLIFTNHDKQLISVSDDKSVKIWDVETGYLLNHFRYYAGPGKEGKIYCAAISPDEKIIAISGHFTREIELNEVGKRRRYAIHIIDIMTGKVLNSINYDVGSMNSLSFSRDGKFLLSASSATATIWNVETGKQHKELLDLWAGHKGFVKDACFYDNDQKVITTSTDRTIKVWDVGTGQLINTLQGHTKSVTQCAPVTNNDFISAGYDGTVRKWDVDRPNSTEVILSTNKGLNGLSISQDAKKFLVEKDKYISKFNIYSTDTGGILKTIDVPVEKLNPSDRKLHAISASAFGKGKDIVAVAFRPTNQIFLFDLSKDTVVSRINSLGTPVTNVGLSPSGDLIGWGAQSGNKLFSQDPLPNKFSLKEFRTLKNDKQYNNQIVGDDFLRRIKRLTNITLRTKENTPSSSIGVYDGYGVLMREVRNNSSQKGNINLCASLTPGGKSVVIGGWHHLEKYSIETGELVNSYYGHTAAVQDISISKDSKYLLSGSDDGTIRLWDLKSGKLLLTYFNVDEKDWIAWIPLGYYVSSPNGDKYIGWHLNNGKDELADYYSAMQFERIFYRPDIVKSYILNSGNLQKLKEKFDDTLFDYKNLRKIAPPKINLLNSLDLGKNKTTHKLLLDLEIYSDNSKIEDYQIYVNNIPQISKSTKQNNLSHEDRGGSVCLNSIS